MSTSTPVLLSKTGGVVVKDKAPKEVYAGAGSHVVHEAEEHKHGGRAKRKHGGHVERIGHIHGEHAAHHAGHKPRKSGGRTGSNMNPLSSAHKGVAPKGHRDEEND
jgi:hypothetical protein